MERPRISRWLEWMKQELPHTYVPSIDQPFNFTIHKSLASSATLVMFNEKNLKNICLKMWITCNNDLYQTEENDKRIKFLLRGLSFNRRFAQEVYLGIVPIQKKTKNVLICGPLIKKPKFENLNKTLEYALVMKRLDEQYRLDHLLYPLHYGNEEGMEFLAKSISRMQRQLIGSSGNWGQPRQLAHKLGLNQKLFREALEKLALNQYSSYIEIGKEMNRAITTLQNNFKTRFENGHIKQCHGDLKATNLWVLPNPQRLLSLDCIDFKAEFCNIDTLSDVAMLAIDLEMRLADKGVQLANHFLQVYLRETREKEDIWPILEYYMTEKAMICAYMSILYDGLPTLGEKYIKVALDHSLKLNHLLQERVPLHRRTYPTAPVEKVQTYPAGLLTAAALC